MAQWCRFWNHYSMISTAASSMRPSVSFIKLVLQDVGAFTGFYGALGLRLNGLVLARCGAEDLGEVVVPSVRPQAVWSHNVDSASDIDALMARTVAAGGELRVPRGATPWGGQRAWFADLDGHLREAVHNPRVHRDAHGGVWLVGQEGDDV